MTCTYHVTFFKSKFDNRVELGEDYTWAELVELFAAHRRTDTKNDLGFIAGTFKAAGAARPAKAPGTDPSAVITGTVGRYGENVVEMHALCIDYDGGATIDEVKAQLAGVRHLGYTSYSHLKDGVTHKFRVIVPLTVPCPAAEWKSRHRNFLPLFSGADASTFMLARIFYAPSTPASEERVTLAWHQDGEAFDWRDVSVETKAKAPPARTATSERIEGDDFPYIRTPRYGECRADALFDLMTEGYAHRVACYRIGDAGDKNAGCFVVKTEDGLRYFDNDGTRRFFKVLRQQLAPVVSKAKKDPGKPSLIDQLRAQMRAKAPQPQSTLTFAEQPIIFELNERYLSPDILRIFAKRGVVAIRSPKGSGKTERIGDLVKLNRAEGRSTLLIGHRIHLLRNLSERTGLSNYQDQEEGTVGSMSAICLNSLGSRTPTHGPHYDTIIIDESEQVLQALVGDHLKSVRNEVYVAFANYIKHARLIVLLDADLTAGLTIETMRLLRGEDEADDAIGILNRFPVGQGRVTKQYSDRYHLLRDALQDAADGERVYYACNSINRATTIARAMTNLGKSVLLVTSETGEKDHVKAFIESPAAEAVRYDCLVTSPTLSTGVSIDAHNGVHHFTRVYGEFSLNPGTFLDADQALSRVRDESVEHRVWIQANTGEVYAKRPEDILDDYIERHRLSSLALPGAKTSLTKEQYVWAQLCTTIDTCVSEWSIYKPQQFRKARTDVGWTIESVAPVKSAIDEGKGAYKQHEPLTDGHAENVFSARQLSVEEYHELSLKKVRTTAEGLSMERYRYDLELEKVGLPFSIENIETAVKQNLLHSLRFARTHIISTHDQRVSSDVESRRANKVTFTDVRSDVKRNELLRYLCGSAGLDFAELHKQALKGPVEVTPEVLEKVAAAFVARQRECNLFFKSRIKDPTHPQAVAKVWNATIGAQTLPLVAKRVQVDGSKVRRYFINSEATSLVLKVLDVDVEAAADKYPAAKRGRSK